MGKFRIRLLILVAALIIAVQGVTILSVLAVRGQDSQRAAQAELQTGLGVVRNVLRYRGSRERLGLEALLSGDHFATLLSQRDADVLRNYLSDHARKTGAEMAVAFTRDGQLITTTSELIDARVASAMAHFLASNSNELDRSFVSLDNRALQFIFAPFSYQPRPGESVRAATGWAGVALPLEHQFVRRMREDMGLDILVWARDVPNASPPAQSAEYSTVEMQMPAASGSVAITLRRSHAAEVAPNHQLGLTMFAISSVALLAGLLVAVLMGRSATRPVDQLVRAAQRIEQGNYTEPVAIRGAVEFVNLGNSLNAMQARIAEREQHIQHQVTHDQLTGLLNLPAVLSQLTLHLQRNTPVAVMLIDICRFRDVNASLGHNVGTQLLIELARQLAKLVDQPDCVGRISGDEFMVLLPGAGGAEAHALAERVVNLCRAGVLVGAHTQKLELRIGFCVAPEHGTIANELLFRADVARDETRDASLAIKMYQPGRDEGYRRRLTLLDELRVAIAEDQLTLAFQPQVFTAIRRIKSFEALARWRHPQLGWIPPSEFIPLAEQSGLIGELTRCVLRKAIAQLAEWRRLGLHVDMAVNLSATDLADKELPGELLKLLEQHQVHADQIVIELTESTVLREPDVARRVMQQLRIAGIRFSIDDFGIGYSSLALLQTMPVDELKIDRSFILDLDRSLSNEAIVRSTIELGHTLGLKVVAEGIETGAVWAKLLSLGCDYGQGYFVSRPMAPEQVVAWTTEMNARLAAALSDTAQVRALSDTRGDPASAVG